MTRVIAALAVLALVSIVSADVVVFEPSSDTAAFNPSYDNLYRPGNPIWALRQMRLAQPEAVYPGAESTLLSTGSMSATSSAEVARPLEAFRADNNRAMAARYYRMSDLLRNAQPATNEEETTNPVFLGVRPTTQPAQEPNRHIVINQLNPQGADNNPARPGEVVIKPYTPPAKRRPVR